MPSTTARTARIAPQAPALPHAKMMDVFRWSVILTFFMSLVVFLSAVATQDGLTYEPVITFPLLAIPVVFLLAPFLIYRRYRRRGIFISPVAISGMTFFLIAILAVVSGVIDFMINVG